MSVTFTPKVVWVTQTQPAGSQIARRLNRMGFFALAVPLVRSRKGSPEQEQESRSVMSFITALRDAISYLPRVEGILIYSQEAARRLRKLLTRRSWRGTVFCISDDCAEELRQCAGVTVKVASSAHEDALIELLRR